ncbi:MAG: hypothetical protein MJZ33_07230 [Paludibacteraceae bacterium]|nr:hypothetical protein [Paludibacteraceae bacterium]
MPKKNEMHGKVNPKIAQYLKAYKYVKEFGEGSDPICNHCCPLNLLN